MAIELRADRTHLYPGARLRFDGPVSPSVVGPAAVHLTLSDGVEVDAELIEEVDSVPDGRGSSEASALVLDVPGFRTAAGTEVGPRLWSIARIDRDGSGATLVVGQRR